MITKKHLIAGAVFSGIFAPMVAFGVQAGVPDGYENTYLLLKFYSLASTVIIGLITSTIVLINGKRMKGGVFGTVLSFFGIGMLFMLAGFTISFTTGLFAPNIVDMLNSMLNIIGFVFMAVAGNKLFMITKQK